MSARRAIAGAVIAAAPLAWGLTEPRMFVLRHATVPVRRDGDAARLSILHLSDLHRWGRARALDAFVRRCLDIGPDLVVVTGDLLGSDDIDGVLDLFARPGAPAVAILGSNDRYGPTLKNPFAYVTDRLRGERRERELGARLDTRRLVAGLRERGWVVPINEHATVETPAGTVEVVALDDPHQNLDRPDALGAPRPAGDAVLRLGLVHAPYRAALDVLAEHGCDLICSGHTHGGQVRLPGFGALVSNCDLPTARARGLSRDDAGPWLHVSAGLGVARTTPVRFACRPEATLLEVVTTGAGTAPGSPPD